VLSTGGACNGSLGQNKTQWYSGDRVGPRCHARVSYCRVCSCWVLVIYFHEALESAIICIAFIMLYLTCRLFVLIFWSLPMFDEEEQEVFFGLFAAWGLDRHVCRWDVRASIAASVHGRRSLSNDVVFHCNSDACSVSGAEACHGAAPWRRWFLPAPLVDDGRSLGLSSGESRAIRQRSNIRFRKKSR
jgi:hypothetical protein